jgi:hypothetical protein
MRRKASTRTPAFAAMLVAGALAAYVLRGSPSATSSSAQLQQPAAEVRTQVIRRTIHIVRHERPTRSRAGPQASGARAREAPTRLSSHTSTQAPRTATSGARVSGTPASGAPALRTRTSPSNAAASNGAPAGSAPVRTHTSGSTGPNRPTSGRSTRPVRTRTSGVATRSGSSTGAVRTRTSGGSRGHDNGGGRDD